MGREENRIESTTCREALALVLMPSDNDFCCPAAALLAVELRLLSVLCLLQESTSAKDKEADRGMGPVAIIQFTADVKN